LEEGHGGIVRLLTEHGANFNADKSLQIAAEKGHEEIAGLLLEHGANAFAARKALLGALVGGHGGIVRLLFEHGANFNTAEALQIAAEYGHEAIITILMEYRTQVEINGPTNEARMHDCLRPLDDEPPISAWLLAIIATSKRFGCSGLTAPLRE
jgi:ankyrin repeat protein